MSCFEVNQPTPIWFINDPELIREVLVTREKDFGLWYFYAEFDRVFGKGLLNSEGECFARSRRLAQPAFHRRRLPEYAEFMVAATREGTAHWQPGQPFDLDREIFAVARRIAARLIFGPGEDTGPDLDILAETSEEMELGATRWILPLADREPFEEACRRFDGALARRIAARRVRLEAEHGPADADGGGDLLALLLGARDEHGQPLSDQQLRDEVVSLFLAGHESTATVLTWIFHALTENQEVEARLIQELAAVLGGHAPGFDAIPRLLYTRQVFAEGLRLYPAAWFLGRRALVPMELGGYPMPPGTPLIISPPVLHRHSRFFPEPDRFLPERWTEEARALRPRFAYIPFSGGARQCIGEAFANIEGVLMLATILQTWKFRPAPDRLPVEPSPRLTLRTRHGLRVIAERHNL